MQIYEYVNFYLLEFYQSITTAVAISIFYFPIHILLTCLLYNNFKLNDLKSKVSALSKPIFCASLLSIAIPWIYGLLIARGLQGAGKYSMPVIIDEIQCLLIILFTIIFARTSLGIRLSWVYAIVLLIFAIPNIGGALHITSFHALSAFTLIIFIPIIAFLTIIQTICIRAMIRAMAIDYRSLFKSLFISNFVSILILKYIFVFLEYLGITCC